MVTPAVITVITGPPCSGKSTYIREHAKPGDLIIDFDRICQGLGGTRHDQDNWLREITAAAWAGAVRRAVQSHQNHHAWIIDAKPKPERLADYQRARARIVALTAPREELHRRADADTRPAGDHDRIDAWFTGDRHRPAVRPRDPAHRVRTRW